MYYEIKTWDGLHGTGRLLESSIAKTKPKPCIHPSPNTMSICTVHLNSGERFSKDGIKHREGDCIWHTHNCFGKMALRAHG